MKAGLVVKRPIVEEGTTKVPILLLENINSGDHGSMGNMAGSTVKLYDIKSPMLHPVGYHSYLLSHDPVYKEKHEIFMFIRTRYIYI